jgi:tetratricopeptide (TPR) repeat protein
MASGASGFLSGAVGNKKGAHSVRFLLSLTTTRATRSARTQNAILEVAMRKFLMALVVLSLAVVVSAQQFSEKSNVNVNQAVGVSPDTSARDTSLQRAALDMIHKDYAGAADIYRELLRETPNDSVTWNRLGIAYHQQSLLGDALKCYERATKVDKTNGDGWNNVGTVYFQEKKFAKAIRAYKKAIALNNTRGAFYGNMGIAYLNYKKVPEALASFRQAVKLDPEVFTDTGSFGTVLQDRSVGNRGMFFFMMAKSFAGAGNAERCAYYLRKSRDEGYVDFGKATTDPGFSSVLTNPSVREILGLPALPPPPMTPSKGI